MIRNNQNSTNKFKTQKLFTDYKKKQMVSSKFQLNKILVWYTPQCIIIES